MSRYHTQRGLTEAHMLYPTNREPDLYQTGAGQPPDYLQEDQEQQEQQELPPQPQAAQQRFYERFHTRPIPLYQRMVHALCLTLIPFIISRLLSWFLIKYQIFPGFLDIPVVAYIKQGLEATPHYVPSPSSTAPVVDILSTVASSVAPVSFSSVCSASPAAASSTSTSSTPSHSLIDKFVHVLVAELGYEQDWWLTHAAGASVFIVYTFIATLAISFSALFHSLCFFFIMGKKWNDISNYLAQFRNGELANLGVF